MKASMLASRSGGKSAPEEGGFLCMAAQCISTKECSFLPGELQMPCTITGNKGLLIWSADLESLLASRTPASCTPRLLV